MIDKNSQSWSVVWCYRHKDTCIL